MINDKIEKMINDQMNFEFYSAYIYKAMAAYCDSVDLKGFANWFKVQEQEENFHADKFYNFLLDRGGRPYFTEIPYPPKDWDSIKAVFEHALKHERIVTERINNIMTVSLKLKDHATSSFLNWYVDEQVEEESNVDSIIKQLKLLEGSGHGLFMIDKELLTRVFTPPTTK